MSTCEGTRYVSDVLARAASLGLAGLATLGCGDDDHRHVSANPPPPVIEPQMPLDGATIPKFVDPLPTLSDNRVDGTRPVAIDMEEFQQKMLPSSVYADLPAPFNAGTFLWGYDVNAGSPQFPARTIEAQRG